MQLRSRRLVTWAAALPLLLAPLAVPALAVAGATPVRSVAITGDGIDTWPAYDPAVGRYAIDTTNASTGAVTVTASSSDPSFHAVVNGAPAVNGIAHLTGLTSGDEVNVQITDGGGTTNQSWIYLPASFPRANVTSQGAGPDAGYVFLTLTSWVTTDRYSTVVDRNGVPIYVASSVNPMDFKPQPAGGYTIAEGHDSTLSSSFDIVHLDSSFRPIGRYNTVGLANTEFHDSILEADGSQVLMAYEHNADTGKTDSIVQDIAPDGTARLTWNSADHINGSMFDPTTNPNGEGMTTLGDYAHMNSIDVMDDGNLLLSFRHTSSVLKVDRTTGTVLWRLGGTKSDFTFPGDPSGGPCAQHTARELANGDIQVWDNGSQVGAFTQHPMCPDPANPGGARIERPFTRVVTYHLDEAAHTATMVKQILVGGSTPEFSQFAGSAQRLDAESTTGHTFVGTADGYLYDSAGGTQLGEAPDAYEYDADGNPVWSLDLPGWYSYRALKAPAPDTIAPTLTTSGLVDGATFTEGTATHLSFSCADAGGSNLATCTSSIPNGGAVPGSVGTHTLTVTATDKAGNVTTRDISYTVKAKPVQTPPATYQPDARVRAAGGRWHGAGVIGAATTQSVTARIGSRATGRARSYDVWIRNTGNRAERFRVKGTHGTRAFLVRFRSGGRTVTGGTTSSQGLLTPSVTPGGYYKLQVLLTRTSKARLGDRLRVKVLATSTKATTHRDGVSVVGTATR